MGLMLQTYVKFRKAKNKGGYFLSKKRKHPLLANIGNTTRCRILSNLESINQFPSQNMPVQITFVLITIEHISRPA
ncbi:hypothetical protein, partial [Bacteroides intestinalis]|uniref:hypothetical protein n=1 Tax=Bacteroides intestinalis TaxID=329854 RepID=UPI001E294D83